MLLRINLPSHQSKFGDAIKRQAYFCRDWLLVFGRSNAHCSNCYKVIKVPSTSCFPFQISASVIANVKRFVRRSYRWQKNLCTHHVCKSFKPFKIFSVLSFVEFLHQKLSLLHQRLFINSGIPSTRTRFKVKFHEITSHKSLE